MPLELDGLVYKNLTHRLNNLAKNVELDGHCNAARLMRNAADTLDHLEKLGLIKLDKSKDFD